MVVGRHSGPDMALVLHTPIVPSLGIANPFVVMPLIASALIPGCGLDF